MMATSLPQPRRVQPIYLWAALGIVFLLLQLYAYGAWIGSSDFRPSAIGPDPVPHAVRVASIVYQILSVAGLPFWIWWFVRGIRQAGTINSTRLFMLGWLSAYWLDPWLNFLRPMFTYNAYAFNRGCWCNFMPGWQSASGGHYAEPLLIDPPAYFSTFTFTALAALACMRWGKRRWPAIGTVGLTFLGAVGVWLTIGLLDVVATRYLGFDAWPIAFHAASLWGGSYYQFPIYEFILFPTPFVICAFLLLHATADGHIAIERGVETITGAPWRRTAARVLAYVAFCNVLNLAYTTAMGVHAVYADPWPKPFPSWLANEQCGGTTGIVCSVHR